MLSRGRTLSGRPIRTLGFLEWRSYVVCYRRVNGQAARYCRGHPAFSHLTTCSRNCFCDRLFLHCLFFTQSLLLPLGGFGFVIAFVFDGCGSVVGQGVHANPVSKGFNALMVNVRGVFSATIWSRMYCQEDYRYSSGSFCKECIRVLGIPEATYHTCTTSEACHGAGAPNYFFLRTVYSRNPPTRRYP